MIFFLIIGKVVKESVIANHLAGHTVKDYEPLSFDLPDKDVLIVEDNNEMNDWCTLYFNRALNVSGNRAKVVVIFLENKQYLISVRLQFRCTNNTIKYEGSIIGLKVALELRVGKLEVYGDSLLIICQVEGEWQTKYEKLKQYRNYLLKLASKFKEIKFTHISRDKNQLMGKLWTTMCFYHSLLIIKIMIVICF